MTLIEKLKKKIEVERAELKGIPSGWLGLTTSKLARIKVFNEVIEMIKNHSDWTPVSEQLPEEDGEYIVCIEGATESTSLYYECEEDVWHEYGRYEDFYKVVAWQPLPAPYKGE